MKILALPFLILLLTLTGAKADGFSANPRISQNTCTPAVSQTCANANNGCGATCRTKNPNGGLGLKSCYTFCCHDWVNCLARHACDTSSINCNSF